MKPYTPLSEPTKNQQPLSRTRGQGALEYLLLIGGAILIATVVLLIIVGTSTTTNTIIANNLTNSNTNVNNAFNNAVAGLGGGGGAVCGNNAIESGEQCDGTASFAATCYTQGYSAGTLGCTATCQFNSSTACSGPGPFNITNTSYTNPNVTLTATFPGANGQTGTLPYYSVIYIKDIQVGLVGSQCSAFQNLINTNPSGAAGLLYAVATNPPGPAAGLAYSNVANAVTPGTSSPITFSVAGLGFAAGQQYCFAISGANAGLTVGVPAVSGLITA